MAEHSGSELAALLWEPPTQRLLAVLAWNGAMGQFRAIAAARLSSSGALRKLENTGLIVRWHKAPTDRRIFVALNDGHPVMRQLRVLLKALIPYDVVRAMETPLCRKRVAVPKKQVSEAQLEWTFRHPTLTKFLVLLEALSRKADYATLKRGLPEITQQVLRTIGRRLVRVRYLRQIERKKGRVVGFNPCAIGICELRSVCRRLLKLLPQLQSRLALARKAPPRETYLGYLGKVPYLYGTETALRPRGFAPPKSETPLLFGTDARYRALATLAICGPMRVGEFRAASQVYNHFTVMSLINSQIVRIDGKFPIKTLSLNASFPAYDELLGLLRKMHRRYPIVLTYRSRQQKAANRIRGPWLGTIVKLCGTPPRTKVLITVGVVKEIDGSSLAYLIPEHARADIRQALHMFTAFKVFERRQVSGAIMYRLNPRFYAAKELRLFLDRIASTWPQYRRRAESSEYMSSGHLAMRRNPKKRNA